MDFVTSLPELNRQDHYSAGYYGQEYINRCLRYPSLSPEGRMHEYTLPNNTFEELKNGTSDLSLLIPTELHCEMDSPGKRKRFGFKMRRLFSWKIRSVPPSSNVLDSRDRGIYKGIASGDTSDSDSVDYKTAKKSVSSKHQGDQKFERKSFRRLFTRLPKEHVFDSISMEGGTEVEGDLEVEGVPEVEGSETDFAHSILSEYNKASVSDMASKKNGATARRSSIWGYFRKRVHLADAGSAITLTEKYLSDYSQLSADINALPFNITVTENKTRRSLHRSISQIFKGRTEIDDPDVSEILESPTILSRTIDQRLASSFMNQENQAWNPYILAKQQQTPCELKHECIDDECDDDDKLNRSPLPLEIQVYRELFKGYSLGMLAQKRSFSTKEHVFSDSAAKYLNDRRCVSGPGLGSQCVKA
ncbi:hypothetical protein BABINDRAFT_160753 [Babjeviella inositovora NRRL Y-12698]|uniref:Uncharacterized protein n=1 Tax=Babjeviella inositovora NRRL Y-12698 TaxID=984486 RepID=A0A1E3QRZ6_9ASCO|nr:uncharacterized protein BABINDRAFT_160753 [Babjeviella inositovora NRRL Y-12698]ODQ80473.1 hypothetical protein BABINDRAFT_160753 [Babjeviella inositovora NRRL Y-12698]